MHKFFYTAYSYATLRVTKRLHTSVKSNDFVDKFHRQTLPMQGAGGHTKDVK